MAHKYEADLARILRIPDGQSSVEVMAYCPFHDNKHTPSMQVNLDTGLWVCFVCERKAKDGKIRPLGGNYKTLLNMLGMSTSTASLVDFEDLARSLREVRELSDSTGVRESKYARMQRMSADEIDTLAKVKTSYWAKRGFCDDTVYEFRLGFDLFSGTVTIPLHDESGQPLNVIRRRVGDGPGPRYAYPKGFPRKECLFNYHRCEGERPLILVEGSLDAIRVWESVRGVDVVAQYGSSLSDRQTSLIRMLLPRRVYLLHDADEAGRKAAAQARSMLTGIECVRLTQAPGFSDPGETPRRLMAEHLKDSITDAQLLSRLHKASAM